MKKEIDRVFKLADYFEDIFKESNKTVCAECGGKCCKSCGLNEGWLYFDLYPEDNDVSQDQLLVLKKLYRFKKTTGFLDTKKKSCKLPRVLRSKTCLGYSCSDNSYKNKEREKFYKNLDELVSLRKKYFWDILKIIEEVIE